MQSCLLPHLAPPFCDLVGQLATVASPSCSGSTGAAMVLVPLCSTNGGTDLLVSYATLTTYSGDGKVQLNRPVEFNRHWARSQQPCLLLYGPGSLASGAVSSMCFGASTLGAHSGDPTS